jgi:hypothetical protein
MEAIPRRLLVLGGGPAGVELAQAVRRLGGEVSRTATYTHADAEWGGFLTLLSDGERLTGAYALGPEAGEWLQQATLAGPRSARGAARHDPALPELLRDLRHRAEGARGRSRRHGPAGVARPLRP